MKRRLRQVSLLSKSMESEEKRPPLAKSRRATYLVWHGSLFTPRNDKPTGVATLVVALVAGHVGKPAVVAGAAAGECLAVRVGGDGSLVAADSRKRPLRAKSGRLREREIVPPGGRDAIEIPAMESRGPRRV